MKKVIPTRSKRTTPRKQPFIGFYNYTIILTYLSVVSALIGMGEVMNGRNTEAVILLLFSGLCDMFDGKVARTRKRRTAPEKAFGIQIDSLADVIAFGVFPAIIGYGIGIRSRGGIVLLSLFVLAALTRLAYYNVTEEERQSTVGGSRIYYEGLPVTSVALIIPVVYGFKDIIGQQFPLVYMAALICISLAFLVRLRIKKIDSTGLLVLIGLGLLELIWILA